MRWRRKKSAPPASSQASETEQQEVDSMREQGFQNNAKSEDAAVFEFGTRSRDGLAMQGVCKAEQLGELPTCIWRVYDPSRAPAEVKEKEAELLKKAGNIEPVKYHIEF